MTDKTFQLRERLNSQRPVKVSEYGEINDSKNKYFNLDECVFLIGKGQQLRCKNDSIITDIREITNAAMMLSHFRNKKNINWLDVGCGNGRIIKEPGLYGEDSNKIHYTGIDFDTDSLDEFKTMIDLDDICSCYGSVEPPNVLDFRMVDNISNDKRTKNKKYNWVSLINVLHEIEPHLIPDVLIGIINCCDDNGFIFIRDIEDFGSYPVQECYALTWSGKEIEKMLKCIGFKKITRVGGKRKEDSIPHFAIVVSKKGLKEKLENLINLREKIIGNILKILREKLIETHGDIKKMVASCVKEKLISNKNLWDFTILLRSYWRLQEEIKLIEERS